MRYRIEVWHLTHNDVPDYRYECYCQHYIEALCVFNTLTRGIGCHYQAWLMDDEEKREVRYSSVMYKGNGER